MAFSYDNARALVLRELQTQQKLAESGKETQVLNIPCLLGPPGMGKTAMAHDIANHFDLPLLIVSCGENSDPTDVAGIPVPVERSEDGMRFIDWLQNRAGALAMDRPVLLFFDEIDKAPPQVQAGLLGIFGNRKFRLDDIHPGTLIFAAGNRVDDDLLANQLSESLLTRVTVIEVEPDAHRFAKWGSETGKIHPAVLGFLSYKPDALHGGGIKAKQYRMETPRGWWEASQQMFLFPNPHEKVGGKENWWGIVSLKCGGATGNDFWAWYEIVQRINATKLLTTGDLSEMPADPMEKRKWMYAAIFSLASELRRGVKPSYTGLETILAAFPGELRLSLAVQLNTNTRLSIAKIAPRAGKLMTEVLLDKFGLGDPEPEEEAAE